MPSVYCGRTLGFHHQTTRANCQDYAACTEVNTYGVQYWVGVVSDGCGSKTAPYSEVGSALFVRAAISCVHAALRDSDIRDPNGFIRAFSKEIVYRMAEILGALSFYGGEVGKSEHDLWVAQHLLATLVGFVVTDNGALAFCYGDGVVHANGETHVVTCENNAPPYPAYTIFDHNPDPDVHTWVADPWQPIYVSTDGLVNSDEPDTWRSELGYLKDGITHHPRSLQRRMNVLRSTMSLTSTRSCMSDDAAVAMFIP